MHKTNCMQSIEHISTWEVFGTAYVLKAIVDATRWTLSDQLSSSYSTEQTKQILKYVSAILI